MNEKPPINLYGLYTVSSVSPTGVCDVKKIRIIITRKSCGLQYTQTLCQPIVLHSSSLYTVKVRFQDSRSHSCVREW